MIIRAAETRDADALAAIYGHHVLHGFGTFETVPPDAAAMDARRLGIQGYGLPFMVAERGGRVLGYASAGPFRPRLIALSRPAGKVRANKRLVARDWGLFLFCFTHY